MNDSISLFLARDDADLHEKVRQLSPRIRVISNADLAENPNLLTQIEVAYDTLSREQVSRATNLRWLQKSSAGVEELLTPEIIASDMVITNVSGIHARPITEHLFGLLLGFTRALNDAHDAQNRREWQHFGEKVESLFGKTLGILGFGAIGEQCAKVGAAFDMKIIGLRHSGKQSELVETIFSPASRYDFFAQSDIVINLLPQTDETKNFMSDAEFDLLPDGAILLNAGRGTTIDTDAMLRALQYGKLKAALLDVTEPEPLPANHALWNTPNVTITAHYSGAHPEYNAEADAIFLDNLGKYLRGETLNHIVDKRAGY